MSNTFSKTKMENHTGRHPTSFCGRGRDTDGEKMARDTRRTQDRDSHSQKEGTGEAASGFLGPAPTGYPAEPGDWRKEPQCLSQSPKPMPRRVIWLNPGPSTLGYFLIKRFKSFKNIFFVLPPLPDTLR